MIQFFKVCPLLFIFSTYASINATPLKYSISSSGNYYPYYTNNPVKPGVLPEIIEKILNDANISASHVTLPTKRITKYLQNEVIDFDVISLEWLSESEQNSPQYIYSEPLINATEMIVSLPENINDWQNANSLYNKNVGTVLGYYYHDDNLFNRIDFPSEKELMIALSRKRIDVAIIGKLAALHWSKQFNVDIAFSQQYSHGLLKIRLLSKHKALLPAINKAINTLHNKGFIQQIADKYIPDIPIQN
ncbi:ABC transporter substrate-binding protein [Pseudoalteromonas sp. BSi20652]|uniref:substrate-binding periplasmic protein n=1 Tax=Pseudoalteromonas sp. BSi20652 TaxID=388384 RepID=UPI0006AD02F7|nr:transporter substrate-binding domain-containing protein [Pseudoalteromonas sp. BSi20652]